LSQKIRKPLIASVLLAVILCAGFVAFLSLSEGEFISRRNIHRYSDAPEVKLSASEIEALLATFGQTKNFSDLGILHGKLAGVIQVNSGNDLIGEYTKTLFDLSGNLSAVQTRVQTVRSYLTSGDRKDASALVGELEQRREQSGILLQSLRSLLKRIGEQYQIDTTSQLTRLNTLSQLYNEYSTQIGQLTSELNTQSVLIQTVLSLNSSVGEAFVGQSLRVFGTLETANGTALENRTLTILWGSNRVAIKSTSHGYFEENASFPIGTLPGFATIQATYEPSGPDKLLYLGSTAQVRVQLFYEPTTITAKIAPVSSRPLDSVTVWGNLRTTHGQKPLENRTLILQLDETSLKNMLTDKSGFFFFSFIVPRTISNGTHTVEVVFNATNDIYAPSNATLPFNAEILATQTQILLDRTTILSGMSLTLNGTVSYVNATYSNETAPPSGNVTVYIDNVAYANATLNSQGSFISRVQVALAASHGAHSILIQYYPDRPWIENSQSIVSFNVISVPIVVLAVSVIAIASVLATYAVRRNKRKTTLLERALVTKPIIQEQAGLSEEFSRSNLIAALDAEADKGSNVRTAYRLAQLMISTKLGIDPRNSETPSEYGLRIDEAAPRLKDSLTRLVELFELVEYSPYPIEPDAARKAREKLLELRDELENVKTTELYKR
jgi:Domain of unknown function (DUF4129)